MKYDFQDQVDAARKEIIKSALLRCDGNLHHTSLALNIHHNTLKNWTKRLGIPINFGRDSNHHRSYHRDLDTKNDQR